MAYRYNTTLLTLIGIWFCLITFGNSYTRRSTGSERINLSGRSKLHACKKRCKQKDIEIRKLRTNFDCNNGKEQQLAANGAKYFGNEKSERTLCGLLNRKNLCKGLKKGWRRLYEANGCDKKRNCESKDKGKDKDKVRANINRRIQVAVFVDNDGLLKYEVGFKCIRKDEDNKYRVDEDSKDEVCKKAKDLRKTPRRRRLLHNGGVAC